ncbi:MAG: IPT/TIG domain-containing protein [Blastocatellales bacterium]
MRTSKPFLSLTQRLNNIIRNISLPLVFLILTAVIFSQPMNASRSRLASMTGKEEEALTFSSSSQATPLVCGDLKSDTIGFAGEVDQFTFNGQITERKTLTLTSSGFTATAKVFLPSGGVLDMFNANGLRQLTLPESGTYVIQVSANNLVSAGSYNIGFECLLPTSPVDATLICGTLLSDRRIDAASQVDQITFSGQANERKTLTLTSGSFTAAATVFSPTGVVVITFNANSQQQLTLPESGTYVIQIRANNLVSTGVYHIGLECLLPTSPVDATLICGTLLSDRRIDAASQVDQITFCGLAGQQVTLTLTSGGFTATATVFPPSGMMPITFNANGQPQLTLSESGTFVVQVRANNLVGTGSYSLGLQCLSPPIVLSPNPPTITGGTSSNMTVTIAIAQSAPITVALLSSNTAVATVPSSVVIPANATSASFPVTGVANGSAMITATLPNSLGGCNATASVTVNLILGPAEIEITPPNPTVNDSIAVRIFGDWPNACVPLNPMHSIANNEIRIATTNPGQICSQVISPWTHNRQIGMLPAGNYQVIVTYNGSEIGRKSFTVNNLVPTLTSLTPNSAQAGGPSFTLTVNGTNFVSGSVVRWNGSDKMTTFVSATQLTAMITAADIAASGMASVTVFNPLPGGGLSNGLNFTINPPTSTRMVQVMDASGNAGGQVMVGIELVSQGDENALGFSLTFNPAILKNPQAVLGSHAAGAMLNTNGSQANQGRFGVALSLSTGQIFPAGNRQIVVVTFMVDASAMAGTTPVGFGDQPISREVVGVSANPLTTTWKPGTVTISTGYEADVSPRPNGNNDGTVTIADWVQCGRFVAMLDMPSTGAGGEFQRADTAPLTTKGDGKLTVADWVQCGRYAARLDPAMAAAGPTEPAPMGTVAANSKLKGEGMEVPVSRWLRVINGGTGEGQTLTMIVELDATGDENALGFSLSFDPAAWRFVSANPAESTSRATAHVNVNEAGKGKIGVLLALSPGEVFSAGTHQLLALSFVPIALDRVGADSFKFSDAPILREAADVNAEPLPIKYAPDSATGRARVDATVSAASFGNVELATESIATIFGDGLSGEAEFAVTSPLATEMAGVSVTVEDSKGVRRSSPLFFVSPTQINYQIPPGTAPGLAAIIVDSPTGIATTTAQIQNIAPGLFSANANGKGVAAAVLLRVKTDGAQVFESVTRYDSTQKMFFAQPIEIGTEGDQLFLILFGTGFRFRSDLSSVSATIGGINSEVLFVGPQGDFTGIDQINLRLPSELVGRGDLDVRLIVDGKPSNAVRINIK